MGVVSTVWTDVSLLEKSGTAGHSPLLRKYLVKLTQRIGLTCLPPRSPAWCYVVSIAKYLWTSWFKLQGFDKCMALGAANYLQENFKTCSSLKVSFTNLLLTKDFAF
jgi:hypothetical protein